MRELVGLFMQLGAGIVLPAWIVKRDEKHLNDRLLERAWPEASFWCSVVTFGLFCLPIHFLRTRRSAKGLGLGLAWTLCVALLEMGLGRLLGG